MGKGEQRAAWRVGQARRVYVRWSKGLGQAILDRLAAGELIYRICAEPGMPTPEAVAKWGREKPDFGAALVEARRVGGRPVGVRGQPFGLCEDTAQAVFERLCDGESLTAIGADPTMPSLSTIFYWRRRFPAFEDTVQLGKRIQAERFCDEGWAMAQAATPETAYLTNVRLGQLRWMAGVMAPRTFRLKPVEPEGAREKLEILIRTFKIEKDPETGKDVVVAYCPNPETGRVEREDSTDWRPAPHQVPMPGGAIG